MHNLECNEFSLSFSLTIEFFCIIIFKFRPQNFDKKISVSFNYKCTILVSIFSSLLTCGASKALEPVCCKKRQKKVPDQLLVWGVGGPLKDLKDSRLILNESKLFPWSSRISLVPFRTFRGPLFPKPVTGQELFLAVSYSKPTLG